MFAASVVPAGGAGENGRESWAPPRCVVAEVIVVVVADGGRDQRIATSAAAAAVFVPQKLPRSSFGIAAATAVAAVAANVIGDAACHRRYSSSVIAVALPGVVAERGEDPTVNGSHGGEEGGGIEDDNNDEYHEGGGGGGGGTAESSSPSPPLTPPEPLPTSVL